MRRSSCCAIDSATSCASSSGLRILGTLMCTGTAPIMLRDLAAQLLDVLALLADHDARTRRCGSSRGASFAGRSIRCCEMTEPAPASCCRHLADLEVGVRGTRRTGVLPANHLDIPVAGDAEADSDRMNFMTH